MAGIAGIYCADGRLAEVSDVRRMVAAVAHRGADGIAYWNSGPVALAHMQFFTTPESLDERQPLVAPGGEACLVWNGRLDNRDELKAELAGAGAQPVDETDAGLVLAAYLEWGADCVQRLVGDFALAIWDARLRRLWCACDYVGVRPFYYFWDGKTFVFGPDVRALLAHPLVSPKINEGMAGELLANDICSREETLYADIRRLTPGRTLTVEAAGGLKVERWWNPDLSLLIYGTDEEYSEHFTHLLDQSVQSQMRCDRPWGIQMSGGLDSSSIAVSARAVLEKIGRGEDRILTFSITSPGKPWDESDDIAAVVEKAKLTALQMEPLRVDLDFFGGRAGYWRDYPGAPNGEPMSLPMFDAAKRQGARVLMSGIGGDEFLDGQRAHLMDLALRLGRPGSVRALLERGRIDWKMCSGEGTWQRFLLRKLIAGAAPGWVHARRLLWESILSEDFLRRTHLAERLSGPEEGEPRFATRAQQAMYRMVASGHETHVLGWNDREAAHAGIELRFPFLDRRLAEFCLRLPEEQRQTGATWKRLLRDSMRGRLPERVRTKKHKAEFSDIFEAVFSTQKTKDRLQQLVIQKRTDWLDSGRLQKRISGGVNSWLMWRVLAADLWFEQVTSAGGG